MCAKVIMMYVFGKCENLSKFLFRGNVPKQYQNIVTFGMSKKYTGFYFRDLSSKIPIENSIHCLNVVNNIRVS